MQNDFSAMFSKKYPIKLWVVLLVICFFLIYVFYHINAILYPFMIAFFGAYILKQPMAVLEKMGICRSLSALTIILLFYFLLILFILWVIPLAQTELVGLIKSYPLLQGKALGFIDPWLKTISTAMDAAFIQDIKRHFFDSLGSIFKISLNILLSMFSNGLAIANILSFFILTPFVMFYILKDWDFLMSNLKSLIPLRYQYCVVRQFGDIDANLTAYMRGQAIVCGLLMIGYSLLLWLVGLPYAFIIGFLTGFLAFIPYLGVTIGFLVALIVGFMHFEHFTDVLKIVGVFAVLSPIEGYFLTPKFIGENIGLHPVLIVFLLFALGSWFGVVGIILALPSSAVITTVVRNFVAWYKEKFVYTEAK